MALVPGTQSVPSRWLASMNEGQPRDWCHRRQCPELPASMWMGLLVPNFHMGDKPVGIRNVYLREWGDFLLGRPWNPRHIPDSSLSCWGRLFVKWENCGPSQPFGFLSFTSVGFTSTPCSQDPPTQPSANKFHVCPPSLAQAPMWSTQSHALPVILKMTIPPSTCS